MLKHSWKVPVIVALAGAAAACSDSTNPMAGRGQTVSLSLATIGAAPAVSAPFAAPGFASAAGDTLVVTDGTNTLRITSVELVLTRVKLNRVSNPVPCDSTSNADACEEFTTGPQLVSMPLGAGTATVLTVGVDSGSYDKVEFIIHKPGSDPQDVQFVAAHPAFANISIRVQGTYNGTAFTYTVPIDQEQEFTFPTPLVIDASGSTTNLTLQMDIRTWFRVGGTGNLFDPASANVGQPNEGVARENIKNSIEAFEDPDRDGDIN